MVLGVSIQAASVCPKKSTDPIHLEEGGAAVIMPTAARLRKDPDFVDSAAG